MEKAITAGYLTKIGFTHISPFEHIRKFGSVVITLRVNAGKCYCDLHGIYVGELESISRLNSLLFGLTGRQDFITPTQID